MKPIKVSLADDHKLFRDGLKALLNTDKQIEVVGEAKNGHELINIIEKYMPDVVLVDISMPELNGLDAIIKLKAEYPDLKFIVLTMHEDSEYIMKSIKHGAHGYLLKNVDEEELKNAVKTVVNGGKYFNSKISGIMIENLAHEDEYKTTPQSITQREKEVVELVAEGLSTKLIADQLHISSRTVETHRVNVMKKLKASNTAELIKKAYELKIIS